MEFSNKNLFLILIIIIIFYALFTRNQQENFYIIQDWPFLPPDQWKERNYVNWGQHRFYDSKYQQPQFVNKWNPLWDSDDVYHPANPQISNYPSSCGPSY